MRQSLYRFVPIAYPVWTTSAVEKGFSWTAAAEMINCDASSMRQWERTQEWEKKNHVYSIWDYHSKYKKYPVESKTEPIHSGCPRMIPPSFPSHKQRVPVLAQLVPFPQPSHRSRVTAGESCSSPALGAANDPAHVSSQLKSEYFWFPVSSCRPDLQESPRAVGALRSPQENIRTALFLQELIHPGPWQAEFCTAQCSCCTCRQDPGLHTAILATQHKNFYWKDSFFLTLVIRLGQMNFINKEQMYYVPHVSWVNLLH